MPNGLQNVRAAQHSFADTKPRKESRKPSAGSAYAAKGAAKRESLAKLAKQMSHNFDATAAHDAVKVRIRSLVVVALLDRSRIIEIMFGERRKRGTPLLRAFAQPTKPLRQVPRHP